MKNKLMTRKSVEAVTHTRIISNGKGITLLALIITIIVMLILAGVSISMIVGEDGILTQAENAKVKQNKAEIKEKVQLSSEYNYSGDNVGKVNLQKTKENIENLNIDGITFNGSTDTVLKVQYNGEELYEFKGVGGASNYYAEYSETTTLEDLFNQGKKFDYSTFLNQDAYSIVIDYKNDKANIKKYEYQEGNQFSDAITWEGTISAGTWQDGNVKKNIVFKITGEEEIYFKMSIEKVNDKYILHGAAIEVDGVVISNSKIFMTEI